MSNNKTPMQAAKVFIDEFKNKARENFNIKMLNKKEARYNPYGGVHNYGEESLPVENDCVYIFKSKYSDDSFAINFNYMEKEKEDWSVHFSYKPYDKYRWDISKEEKKEMNKKIENSSVLTFDEFRLKMKEINGKIENGEDKVNFLAKVFDVFFDNKIKNEQKKEFDEKANEIKNFIEKKVKTHEIKKDSLRKQEDRYKKAVVLENESDEAKKIKEIEVKIENLKNEKEKLEEKIEERLKEERKKLNDKNKEVKNGEKKLKEILEKEINKSPVYLKESLRKRFKLN